MVELDSVTILEIQEVILELKGVNNDMLRKLPLPSTASYALIGNNDKLEKLYMKLEEKLCKERNKNGQ